MELILKKPIVLKKESGELIVEKLNFVDEVKVKHLKLFPKSFFNMKEAGFDPASFSGLICILSGVSEEIVDELSFEDLKSAIDVVTSLVE